VSKRTHLSDAKNRPNTKSRPALLPRSSQLFGEPLLLEGEDAVAYELLLARFRAAVQPTDVIDEMYIAEVVSLQWEVLRWRRLKFALIRAQRFEALQEYFNSNLDYETYEDYFEDDLLEVIKQGDQQSQPDAAKELVRKYVSDDPEAIQRVETILRGSAVDIYDVHVGAAERAAGELVQEYARGKRDAVTLVNRLLANKGKCMAALTAAPRADQNFEHIERIDRLTTIAEGRRNNGLHEIERRRAVLGARLRHNVHETEEVELKEIEATATKGKNAH
jgi:hypothetical protein